jgi:protein-S-isoprenylcysteine O-methyltransferase Ste14
MTINPRPANSRNTGDPDHAEVVIHPPILWGLLVLIGIGINHLIPLPFLPTSLPTQLLGGAIWLAGFAIALIAIWQFRRAKTDVQVHTPTSTIVETGIYAWSRNPIYLGGHIGLAGVAVSFNSLWILAGLVPFFLVIRYGVIAREEAYLENKFGPAYLGYKQRVRRWF